MKSGNPYASIHVDLDGGSAIYSAHGWNLRSGSDLLFESGMRNMLSFLGAENVKATFFAIADDLKDGSKRELLQEAIIQGHEIASHSLTHQKLTNLTSDQKRREVFESREKLSRELGVPIQGFRAPAFDIDRQILELVDEAGYRYDSSVFPDAKFSSRIGVSTLKHIPHQPIPGRALVELPLPRHSPLPFPFHICYSLVIGIWYFRLGLANFRRTTSPLILLFHLTDFADPLPREARLGWKADLYTLSFLSSERKRHLCEKMLYLAQQHYTFVDTNTLISYFLETF